jgi:hypothetical protein
MHKFVVDAIKLNRQGSTGMLNRQIEPAGWIDNFWQVEPRSWTNKQRLCSTCRFNLSFNFFVQVLAPTSCRAAPTGRNGSNSGLFGPVLAQAVMAVMTWNYGHNGENLPVI